MKRMLSLSLAVTLLAVFSFFSTAYTQSHEDHGGQQIETAPDRGIIPHRLNSQEAGLAAPTGSTAQVTPAISWHGGPVMAVPVIYIVWYGNWNQANSSDTPTGQQIVRDFANSIGGSPYFNLNISYTGVTGSVLFGNETTDSYSQGARLRDADVQRVVSNAISSGHLPYDSNGVYFVLTSSDVSEQSGFCSRYCGWHTAATPKVGHIRYSFVGNANRCLNACAIQTVGPNGNAGVDAMISIIAHELEEATTDPDLNAWYDSSGAENADKCAWTFGHFQYQVPNGAWANISLTSRVTGTKRDYLIQRNLYHGSNGTGDHCLMDATHN